MTLIYKKNNKKYWQNGGSSSDLHTQNMIDKYGDDYTKNKLTKVILSNDTITIPVNMSYVNRNALSYYSSNNAWRQSTYHLNYTFRTKMNKLPSYYSGNKKKN